MEPQPPQNIGMIRKLGNFLGISKFGQGLATTGRILSGATGQDIKRQEENTANVSKIIYAARQEKDPTRRARLLQLAKDQNQLGTELSASNIDPGLNLSNKEIIGSAANVGLNILTPGAFKGGKAAVLAKNIALGSAYGASSGLEKNRPTSGIVGSAVGGALVGGAIGGATIGLKALRDFTSKATPKWLMEKAIRPTLDENRKIIKYGQQSLGQELLREGVKGSPQKLLELSDSKLNKLEDDLQNVLSHKSLSEVKITRESIAPHLEDLIRAKAGTPGLGGDVQRIKNVFDSIPEEMSLQEANQMKRRIYNELRDVSYKLDAKLGTKAKALKAIASGLKQEIEKQAGGIGGTAIRSINQKLALYGRLENRIVDQMARSMKNNSFSLTDAILTSGGLATLHPLGMLTALGGVMARHTGTSIRTGLAQGLSKLGQVGEGRLGRTLLGGARRATLNIP